MRASKDGVGAPASRLALEDSQGIPRPSSPCSNGYMATPRTASGSLGDAGTFVCPAV